MRAPRPKSHRYALLASLATLAAICGLTGAGATEAGTRAGVTCRFQVAEHRLTVTFHNDDANGGIVRDGDELIVEYFGEPIACAGAQDPTRFNTDRVRARASAQDVDDLAFDVDLSAGPLAPGFSDEGDGTSEIEVSIPFPAGSGSRVPIVGGPGPDRILLGHLPHRQGANLNPAEGVDDPDVRIRGAMFYVLGFDFVSARGEGVFIGPYRRSLLAVGTPGDDVLAGGPKGDYLIARGGHDTMRGGGGEDFLRARDKTRDAVKCGRGADLAKVDRVDRLRRCEDVRTRRSSSR